MSRRFPSISLSSLSSERVCAVTMLRFRTRVARASACCSNTACSSFCPIWGFVCVWGLREEMFLGLSGYVRGRHVLVQRESCQGPGLAVPSRLRFILLHTKKNKSKKKEKREKERYVYICMHIVQPNHVNQWMRASENNRLPVCGIRTQSNCSPMWSSNTAQSSKIKSRRKIERT